MFTDKRIYRQVPGMPISTELFVVVVHLIGYPLFLGSIGKSGIRGKYCFIGAYTFILLSNILTVAENLLFAEILNICEHLSISIAAILLFAAVMKFSGFSSVQIKKSNTPVAREKVVP